MTGDFLKRNVFEAFEGWEKAGIGSLFHHVRGEVSGKAYADSSKDRKEGKR
ncbi:MAG: hypothetical protein LBR80_14260 [Deltaproteobacteria bacterium]|nr:hypothetical protein [Deltaproteobacteria bacterium]